MIVGAVTEPRAEICASQPAPPANLQHLVEVKGVDSHCDGQTGQDAKNTDLAEELATVKRLERIVERVVPFIDQDADPDVPEIERNHCQKESPRRPLLLGSPIRPSDSPCIQNRGSFCPVHHRDTLKFRSTVPVPA